MSQVLDTSQKVCGMPTLLHTPLFSLTLHPQLLLYNDLQSSEESGKERHAQSSLWEQEQEVIRFIDISDIETALKMRE